MKHVVHVGDYGDIAALRFTLTDRLGTAISLTNDPTVTIAFGPSETAWFTKTCTIITATSGIVEYVPDETHFVTKTIAPVQFTIELTGQRKRVDWGSIEVRGNIE